MPTIARDDFSGSGTWDSNLWPFVEYQDVDNTGGRPVTSRSGGIGRVTGAPKNYGYGRYYFDGTPLRNYGFHVKGRFGNGNSDDENIRFFIRGSRAGRNNLDWTWPATGFVVSIFRESSTITFEQLLNSNIVQSYTRSYVGKEPGTAWWNLRVEVEDGIFRAKFWFDGTTEPSAWNRQAIVPSTFPAGEAGFGTGYQANQITDFDFFITYNFVNELTFAGSIRPAGTLRRGFAKKLAGSITAAGTFAKSRTVFRTFTGSIAAAGKVSHSFLRQFTGSIRPTGQLRRSGFTKALSGSITPSAKLRFGVFLDLRGSIRPEGNVVVKFIGRIVGRPGFIYSTIQRAAPIRAWFTTRGDK